MVYLEARPIIGRADSARWWLIQLPNNEQGWVSDSVVAVNGNLNGVPIVATDTGSTPWTPNSPDCEIIPTSTPMGGVPTTAPTKTRTPRATREIEPSATIASDSTVEAEETAEAVGTTAAIETADANATAENVPTATPEGVDTPATATPTIQPTATVVPLDDVDSTSGGGSAIPLVGGVGLVAVGIALFFARRRGGDEE
jgi:hypothetical protein